ncbi:MAG TPA: hypothetical protein VHD36_06845 [Pirellulales bacterium]|nr:hypothetical protein [Pirellulales bacterium]
MTAPSRHRWIAFGLAIAGVLVAIAAFLLLDELAFIRGRKLRLVEIYTNRWSNAAHSPFKITPPPPAEWAQIPFWRRMLGDAPVDYVVLGAGHTGEDAAKVRQWFPEARLYKQTRAGLLEFTD